MKRILWTKSQAQAPGPLNPDTAVLHIPAAVRQEMCERKLNRIRLMAVATFVAGFVIYFMVLSGWLKP